MSGTFIPNQLGFLIINKVKKFIRKAKKIIYEGVKK